MSNIRSKDTSLEIIVRKYLWAKGYRYRVNVKALNGCPDIVMPKFRTAIFVNGCFWHGHDNCKLFKMPKTRTEFWKQKIGRNRERDIYNYEILEANGWNVVLLWECELQRDFNSVMRQLEQSLVKNKTNWDEFCVSRKAHNAYHREEENKRQKREHLLEQKIDVPDAIRRLAKSETE